MNSPAIRKASKLRREEALRRFEETEETTYWDVAMDMGCSEGYVALMIRRAQKDRKWNIRQDARKEDKDGNSS